MNNKDNRDMKEYNEGWLGQGSAALFNLPTTKKWTKPSAQESTSSQPRHYDEWLIGGETGRQHANHRGGLAAVATCGRVSKEPIAIEGYNSSIKDNPFLRNNK